MNIPYVMKKCSKCGRWLVASEANFHKMKSCKYGLNSQCKECYNKKNRAKDNPVNTDINITRVCTSCGKRLPATEEYFRKHNGGKYGLRSQCRECEIKKNKQYYWANTDKKAEYNKQYRKANKDKRAEYQKKWRKANRDKTAEYSKRYYEANRDKMTKHFKLYNLANKDKIAEYQKQYYLANKEKINEHNKKYWKQYRQTPQGQVVAFNSRQRRRIKEEQQGTGLTKDQWLEMMSFFNWECAYSGERLTDKTRSVDHIVSLDAGGDNMVWNMVPMARNLNSSKHTKEMLEWYREQSFFSEERLAKIYEWQEYAYNKWGKDTEYFNTNDIQISLI